MDEHHPRRGLLDLPHDVHIIISGLVDATSRLSFVSCSKRARLLWMHAVFKKIRLEGTQTELVDDLMLYLADRSTLVDHLRHGLKYAVLLVLVGALYLCLLEQVAHDYRSRYPSVHETSQGYMGKPARSASETSLQGGRPAGPHLGCNPALTQLGCACPKSHGLQFLSEMVVHRRPLPLGRFSQGQTPQGRRAPYACIHGYL